MKERSFDEMIAYVNRRVSEMDIAQGYKMELLGMVTALGFKHEKSAQRWIPCSERLPDLWDEKYLVSLAWGGVGAMEYKSTGFHNYGSFSPVPIETVTAWMPLPEPYKGEQE